jgi:DNA-binding HxlR family transcriptional regulator
MPPIGDAPSSSPAIAHSSAEQVSRSRLGDDVQNSLVIGLLGDGVQRFNEIRRGVDGISQRMLAVTLRGLERDGLIARRVYPTVPPRVEYSLTVMGRTLLRTVCELVEWADR